MANTTPLLIWLFVLAFFAGMLSGIALTRSHVRLLILKLVANRARRGSLWSNALRDVYIECGGGDGDIPRQDYE